MIKGKDYYNKQDKKIKSVKVVEVKTEVKLA